MNISDPKALLEEIYDEEFGLRLSNFSIKPVHVANGLARALTGRTYDTTALAKTLRRFVRNQRIGLDEERNPNDVILEEYSTAFEPLSGSAPDQRQLARLRSLAFEVLGADDAVYDQPDKSSYTLSNERFISRDPSDSRAGLFLSKLLMAGPSGRTDAADCIRDLLRSETDPFTTLAWPLLQLAQPREESDSEELTLRAAKSEHLFTLHEDALVSNSLRLLRDSYDRLGRFERLAGSKLNSLRRLMLFGSFAIHVHVIGRWAEREPDAPRPPILLDLFDGALVSVRDASRATLRAAGDAIEGLVRSRFRDRISDELGTADAAMGQFLGQSADLERHRPMYENYRQGGSEPLDALTRVLVEEAFEKAREHPIGALVELGRRAGFLAPWHNQGRGGKLQKRYCATAEFLEILIACTVEPDEPLEFPEFLDRLRELFGIVVGRPDDDSSIRLNNLADIQFGPVTSINEEDLRRNVEEMRRLVVESGYAKAYADGRTMITTRPEGIL